MGAFTYVATDVNGKTVRGREIAEDYLELTEKLKSRNLFCTSYKEVQEKTIDVKYKMNTKDLSFISRQLASMLAAGISLVKALHILVTQQENKKMKQCLQDIYEEVQKGRSFSDALKTKPGTFPNTFLSMVSAGEASGNLDNIMARVSEYYDKQNKMNNKIKSAMTYPIVLLTLVVVIVIAMFTFIMPIFMDMFTDESQIPPLTAFLAGMSDGMKQYWYIILAVVIALIFVIRISLKTPSTRLKIDKMLCTMPKVGPLLCTVYTARFARTMSNLFASGMQMVDCIQKSVDTLGNSYISYRFEEVIENVKRGETLSNSIQKIGIFDGMFCSIIYVGEESGTLDTILSSTSDYYDDEADSAIGKLVGLMEPLMIIILGVGVGLVLAAIFPALYGSFNNIQ